MNSTKCHSIKAIIIVLSLCFSTAIFAQSTQNQITQGQKLLIHQVYFWMKPNMSSDQIALFEKGVKSLLTIKSVKFGDVGKPANTPVRAVVDNSYSYALTVMYDDVAAHDTYQSDPIHLQFLKDCSQLWTNVQVYDSFSIK